MKSRIVPQRIKPETYVVRIYRRAHGQPRKALGVVETADSGRSARFEDLADLIAILVAPRSRLGRSPAARDPPHQL
jgi:hypothetical protein